MALLQRLLTRPTWCSTRLMATMKSSPATSESCLHQEDFFSKQGRLSRPLSPHLTIYKPQVTSMLSLTHRTTGICNAGALYGFAIGTLLVPGTYPAFLMAAQATAYGPPLIMLVKFGLSWTVSFHVFNGLRHLAWDMGHGFQLPDLYKTGYFVLGLSFVTAAIIANL